MSIAPIPVGRTEYSWAAVVVVPVSEITAEFNETFVVTIVVGFIGLTLLTIIVWRMSKGISESLESSNELLKIACDRRTGYV